MFAYRLYIVIPQPQWNNAVPAHWGLPVDINYVTYDPGNRDIIFGGWNRDGNGNPTTWRRPTWKEVVDGVPGVHTRQVGGWTEFDYTYPTPSVVRWGVTKFAHPHHPAAMPITSGGDGLLSLVEKAKLGDVVTRVIDSTIQECIDDETAFYVDAGRLLEWQNAEIAAGNLELV